MFSMNHRRRSSSAARRNRRAPCLEQLETRTLLSGWTIAIGNDTNSTIQPSSGNAVDTAGNTYVTGFFSGSFDFDPSAVNATVLSSNSTTIGGGNDVFAARYNADGSFAWARKFGGTTRDQAAAIAFDGTSAVYVAGFFTGSADFSGDGIVDVKSAGSGDSFVVKLNAAGGETMWYRTFGGTGQDQVNDLSVLDGQVYMTGEFRGPVDFNPGPGVFSLQSAAARKNNPSTDAFVSILDANGAFVTAWQMGGTGTDQAFSLQVDSGSVFVLGSFTGTADFQPGTGTLNKTSAGDVDVFLARYSLTGSPLTVSLAWVQTIGSPRFESAYQWVIATSNDAIYVSGSFAGELDVDPDPIGSHIVNSGDQYEDALTAKYKKLDGSFLWARTHGQLGTHENAIAVVIDPVSGNVYFGASFYGTQDFNPLDLGGELTSAGDRDSVLIKRDSEGNFINAWRFGGEGSR